MKLAGFFREFEDADPDFPSLLESVGKLPTDQRKSAANYLRGGSVIATTGQMESDFITGEKNVAEMEVRTDGTWAWLGSFAHYVEMHGVGVPKEFLHHMSRCGWKAPTLSKTEVSAASDDFRHTPSGPVPSKQESPQRGPRRKRRK